MKSDAGQAMQRVGSLAGLPSLVVELGGSPEEVFAGTGVVASELRADRFIPVALFVELLERAVTATRRLDFAIQLGLRQTPLVIGPVGRLMILASTLGEALADFVTFQISNSSGAAVYLHRIGNDFAFGIGLYDRAYQISRHPYDLSIALGCSFIRHLTQGQVRPLEIMLIRREPEDPRPYHRLAQCPVRFDQAQCCIVLSKQQLAFRLPSADAGERAVLLRNLNEAVSRAPWGFSGQARHALRPALLQGKDSLQDIARAIGMHERTLERHLRQEGTSFEALKDEVRFTLAKELLALTDLHVGEISTSLSYASHSSFVHAFRRWTASTPTKWRQEFLGTRGS